MKEHQILKTKILPTVEQLDTISKDGWDLITIKDFIVSPAALNIYGIRYYSYFSREKIEELGEKDISELTEEKYNRLYLEGE